MGDGPNKTDTGEFNWIGLSLDDQVVNNVYKYVQVGVIRRDPINGQSTFVFFFSVVVVHEVLIRGSRWVGLIGGFLSRGG